VSLILGCSVATFAQNLGEIARQERERRKEQPPRATYVYTNDDLQRQHILVPEDQARALAARTGAPGATVQVALPPASPAPVVVTASPAPITTTQVKPSPLEAVSRLVREAPVPGRPKTPSHHPAQPVIFYIPFGVRPSPAAQTKIARHDIATSHVARTVFSRPERHSELLDQEPVDLGVADVIAVQRGDSLWALARRYLGTGRRWRELAALNTQVLNPNVLHVGEWICLPPGSIQTAHEKTTPRARAPATTAQASAPVVSPAAAFPVQIASHRPLTRP
jgi:nucleoid-associated protein YgaU